MTVRILFGGLWLMSVLAWIPGANASYPLPAGAVAWWRAESDNIDSLTNIEGVIKGNVAFAEGKVGRAFSLDGDKDAIQLGNPAALQLQEFTIECWIRRTSINLTSLDPTWGNGTVLSYGENGYTFGVFHDGRLLLSKNGIDSVSSSGVIYDTHWHHIAVTKKDQDVYFYLDGNVDSIKSYRTSFAFTSVVAIGASRDSLFASFLGLIDELTVYNRALNPLEIEGIYSAGSEGKIKAPPVALNDGIPQEWRREYFGTGSENNPVAAAVADPDHDTANNYQEYLGGTDPSDSASVPTVPVRVTTLAGGTRGHADGIGTNAMFYAPGGLANGPGGLWILEGSMEGWDVVPGAHRIRLLDSSNRVMTLTGSAEPDLVEGDMAAARYRAPSGVVFDHSGNAFVADRLNHRIRKISPDGMVTTFAGSTQGYQDGQGATAMFNEPIGIAIDKQDNLYVADFANFRVRKVTPAGVVSTYAGGMRGQQDGPLATALFDTPNSLAFAPDGSLYVSDWAAHKIRKISPEGRVSTFAEGLIYLEQVTVDSSGCVFATVNSQLRLIKFHPDGHIVWEMPFSPGFQDGPIEEAKFAFIDAPLIRSSFEYLIVDANNWRIRQIFLEVPPLVVFQPKGILFTNRIQVALASPVATAAIHYTLDGQEPGTNSPVYGQAIVLTNLTTIRARAFNHGVPISMVYEASYTPANVTNSEPVILYASISLEVTTLAGDGLAGYRDGDAAEFNHPNGGWVDTDGMVYIADTYNHRIRSITPTGIVKTIAGSGAQGYLDGLATRSQFNQPLAAWRDPRTSSLIVADASNHRIRRISSNGSVTTIAGSGSAGYRSGVGSSAQFNFPNDVVGDARGNLYVSDFNNHAIRRISASGLVTTVAGNGKPGYRDGNGSTALLNQPGGLAIDASGNLFFTEYGGHRIRKLSTTSGAVTTIAGNGVAGYVDGSAAQAQFCQPDGIAVGAHGILYVTDSGNHSIRQISPLGVVETLAGTGIPGFKDNQGTHSEFNMPTGIGITPSGDLIATDWNNHRVRKISMTFPAVARDLPESYNPGTPFPVRLRVVTAATTLSYAVEEVIPPDCRVTAISHEGVFDAITRKVKFGPFFDHVNRNLEYTIEMAADLASPLRFQGVFAFDSQTLAVVGDDTITASVPHPADNNPGDWRMAIGEIVAYSAAWKQGMVWPIGPNPVPMTYVTRAAFLWKQGEAYRQNGSLSLAPLCWTPQNVGIQTSESDGVGYSRSADEPTPPEALASFAPSAYVPGEPIVVTINLVPMAGTQAWAVEEEVPPGWLVSAISEQGLWSEATGHIRWGPFMDAGARTLSYTVAPPTHAQGTSIFRGSVSMDGAEYPIQGAREIKPALVSAPTLVFQGRDETTGQLRFEISGRWGLESIVEVSSDLVSWQTMNVIPAPDGSLTLTINPDVGAQFYRIREVP
ncbi:MAG TPA: chitobiase/beta-hexosaminidase C-terminal domain-containing protein [Candidatus Paceibacterota bacterium]|nr:chitobiase/beta-hexosaminidase C-terminal domain-containing protein [Candidatus Paceibacterota bacterium]